jgi:4-hydroxy-2-oxoheptanedioate aldolase
MLRRAACAALLCFAIGLLITPVVYSQRNSESVRLSQLASLFDQRKVTFGQMVNFGNNGADVLDAISHANDKNLDFIIYDMEHSPFDVKGLRTYMQFLLDPGAIAKAGDVKASKPVLARIPAYGWELDSNAWQVKQVLDAGAHGVVFPHIETAEQALSAAGAMRYPQKPGVADFEPAGRRGWAPAVAARYWGVPVREYEQKADLWGLDADGNLIPFLIIENRRGVENVREIARQLKAKNVTAVLWAGTGDMGMSYQHDEAAVDKGVDAILAAGKEFGMPVALSGSGDVKYVKQRIAQGARVFMSNPTEAVRQAAGR